MYIYIIRMYIYNTYINTFISISVSTSISIPIFITICMPIYKTHTHTHTLRIRYGYYTEWKPSFLTAVNKPRDCDITSNMCELILFVTFYFFACFLFFFSRSALEHSCRML